uniref:Uncharacterized protein n=1 Tax=Anguilla anguilla TaxID=7936 RepID=A0A0E9QUI0_ANGAN
MLFVPFCTKKCIEKTLKRFKKKKGTRASWFEYVFLVPAQSLVPKT